MSEKWTFEKLMDVSQTNESLKKAHQKARKAAKKVAAQQQNDWQKKNA